MKTQVKIFATLFLMITSLAAFSVDPPNTEKNVQVLPAEAGTLKILYINPDEKQVTVRIYNEQGLVFKDLVKIKDNEKGFIKRYDITSMKCDEFWVEIGDSDMASKFRVKKDADGNLWATYWDDFSQHSPAVAAN